MQSWADSYNDLEHPRTKLFVQKLKYGVRHKFVVIPSRASKIVWNTVFPTPFSILSNIFDIIVLAVIFTASVCSFTSLFTLCHYYFQLFDLYEAIFPDSLSEVNILSLRSVSGCDKEHVVHKGRNPFNSFFNWKTTWPCMVWHIACKTEIPPHKTVCISDTISLYCRVPARRGLQQTARATTRHRARDPLVRLQVDQITTQSEQKCTPWLRCSTLLIHSTDQV